MKQTSRQQGTLHRKTGEKLGDVMYSLTVTGPDDAFGHLSAPGDPNLVIRLLGDPASAASGGERYFLVTSNNARVEIFFSSSDGTFTCQSADEAAEALK